MIRILLITPYEELHPIMEQYLKLQHIQNAEVDVTHIYGTDADLQKISKYNIVAARGITGKYIKNALPKINVVEIPMTSDDVVSAVNNSVQVNGRVETAVILPDTEICNTGQLEELSGLRIRPYYVSTQEDVNSAIDDIICRGITAIVGGMTVCSRCKELGLSAIQLRTGAEAMKRTIQVALGAAETLRKEYERANLMTTILNSGRDAIVALDGEGFVMTANTQAESFFARHGTGGQPIAGKHIREIFPEWSRETAAEGQLDGDMLVKVSGQLALVHQTPIVIDAAVAGVLLTIQNAEQIRKSETTIRKQLNHKGMTAKYHFENIVGKAPSIRHCIATANKYSQVDSNVLILGDTGTGKELFAQSIHNASPRRNQPFVAVNCAALPEQLLESELFGYSEGAFSG
ncbi:MAG: sigma 54-interacting transcriptional regulator, partial [Angelakisella sp.]